MQALSHGLMIAFPVLGLCTYFDSLYYGRPTLVSLNFLKFNVLTSGSDYFGIDSFFSYFTAYLPMQLNAIYPFLFLGAFILIKESKSFFEPFTITAFVYLLTISQVKHKEARFTVPVLPLLFTICSIGLSKIKNLKIFNLNFLKILLSIFLLVSLGFNFYLVVDQRSYAINDKIDLENI